MFCPQSNSTSHNDRFHSDRLYITSGLYLLFHRFVTLCSSSVTTSLHKMPFQSSSGPFHEAMSRLSVADSTLTIHYACSHSRIFHLGATQSHNPLPPGVKHVDAFCSDCEKYHEAVHPGMTCNQFCTFLSEAMAVSKGDIRHTCGHIANMDVWVSADVVARTKCESCVVRREKNEQRLVEARQGFRRG